MNWYAVQFHNEDPVKFHVVQAGDVLSAVRGLVEPSEMDDRSNNIYTVIPYPPMSNPGLVTVYRLRQDHRAVISEYVGRDGPAPPQIGYEWSPVSVVDWFRVDE
jgi:hypothetical protein